MSGRVMVLGGAGFLGAHTCLSLRNKGFDVVAYDLAEPMAGSAFEEHEIEFVRGDVLDQEQVAAGIRERQVEGIVDAVSGGGNEAVAREDPTPTIRVNVKGTFNALEAARKAGIGRFVYVSTGGVYGASGVYQRGPISEDEPIRWRGTIYHPSHYMGEILVEMYQQVYGLDSLIVRPLSMYGPALTRTLRAGWQGFTKFYDVWIQKALRGENVEVRGSDTLTDLTYVKDVADGLALAYAAPRVTHRLFNMSSGTLVTHRAIGQAVAAQFPGVRFEYAAGVQENPLRPNRGPLDTTRARDELGFMPRWRLEAGMAAYIAWVRAASAAAPSRAASPRS